ncbi:hypothetical protein YC2023_104593 [Brassica napus]
MSPSKLLFDASMKFNPRELTGRDPRIEKHFWGAFKAIEGVVRQRQFSQRRLTP